MSQPLPVIPLASSMHLSRVAVSASVPEKTATSSKARSCTVCRTRKVRCDRESPCSNCRRANIACVSPSADRPPRWARRLERVANSTTSKAHAPQDQDPVAAQVVERLRRLESLVKELSGQLEQASGAAAPPAGKSPESSSHIHNSDVTTDLNAADVQKQFGRLVIQDADRSRYVSGGFWSRVSDELNGLKMDSYGLEAYDSNSDTSDDEVSHRRRPPTQEPERTPSERHAFLFGHNLSLSAPDLRELRPLPSQIPFLLDIFRQNVNSITRIVHVSTIKKMVHVLLGREMASLTPVNEALMFSIYYAAITSMEEDDVMANFGFTQTDLSYKYRLGLEYALAKADFLNVPDLTLLQSFAIFLGLIRHHESPRFVWMMTGLLVRMGQALGLHRDGTHFEKLTPYDIEMRRRLWGITCIVDMRASEDQGTDCMIALGSYDTKLPSNINDADIEPASAQMPKEREGITDMTFSLLFLEIGEITKRMMAQSNKEGVADMKEQSRFLNEIYQKLENRYPKNVVEPGNILHWVAVIITRLVMAKMTLFIYLPVLFSSHNDDFSEQVKNKLLVSAIEIAEYNHALNSEQACRHWRWLYLSYIHWYAFVYLLLEVSRRPWSPVVERAWVALHSPWLIPVQSRIDKSLQIWVPLRKLMAKARKHRDAELERLRKDPEAAKRLEMEDEKIPNPGSPGPFPAGSNVIEIFLEQWRQLLAMRNEPSGDTRAFGHSGQGAASKSVQSPVCAMQPSIGSTPQYNVPGNSGSGTIFMPPHYLRANELQTSQNQSSNTSASPQTAINMNEYGNLGMEQPAAPLYDATQADIATNWSIDPYFSPWLWADTDPSVDVFASVDVDAMDINMNPDIEIDWYDWVQSAKGVELDVKPTGNWQA